MSRSIEGISKATLYNYNLILCNFMNFFNTKTVSMITYVDIQYFLANYKRERKVKNSTLRRGLKMGWKNNNEDQWVYYEYKQ